MNKKSLIVRCLMCNGVKILLLFFTFNFSLLTFHFSIVYAQDVLTLQKCIDMTLKNNHLVRITRKKLVEAKGKKQEAFGHFLPSLTASASYTRLSEVPTLDMTTMLLQPEGGVGSLVRFYGYDTFQYRMGEENNYSASLSLSQPIFTWGKIRLGYKLASLNYNLTEAICNQVESEIIFNVKKTFYSVLLAKKFLEIAEEAVEVMEDHYQVIKSFYKEGKVSSVDVDRVKVLLANAKTKKIKAANGLKLAKKALYNLINIDSDREWKIEGELNFEPDKTEMNLKNSITQALENRPEIKQVLIQKKMAECSLKLARAENRPTLALVGNYEYKKPFYFENEWDKLWNAGCYLTFPLFNGFSNCGRIKQAKAQISQVEIAHDQLKKGINLEIENIYLDLKEAEKRIYAQKENVSLAKKNLEIIQKRYERGLVSDLDLRETQLALTQAETEYSQALFDYNVALAKLQKAVGKARK